MAASTAIRCEFCLLPLIVNQMQGSLRTCLGQRTLLVQNRKCYSGSFLVKVTLYFTPCAITPLTLSAAGIPSSIFSSDAHLCIKAVKSN